MSGFKYYSIREMILRVLWSIAYPLLFRMSIRHFYGWRNFLLRMFGAHIGRNVKIFPSVKITFPWLLTISDDVVISWGVKIYNLGQISIGSKTIISQYAHLCGGTHDLKAPGFKLIRSGLKIGDNVWIAAESFIGPGVNVNNNAVVGARAVVVKDVNSTTIVAGNPAKVVGERPVASK